MKLNLEAYISREIIKNFKEHTLVATNETLPGQIKIDFHLRDTNGTDIFVETSMRKINRFMLSKILNLYSSISNIEPPLKKFKLLIVGSDVTSSIKKEFEKLPIQLLSFKELGITKRKLREIENEQRQLQIRRLPPEEAKLVAKWEADKKKVIRASDIQIALNCTANYAYVLLHNLEQNRWLDRIRYGVYQFVPAAYGYPDKIPPVNGFAVGAAFIEPYYFSYYTSNSHYGFTTQVPFTFFIATTEKKPLIEWQSVAFKFVTLSRYKFFGFRRERVFDADVYMAEPEKSIVDSFDKPRYAGGIEQLARIIWRGFTRINQRRLVDYALKMRSKVLVQRLGFIIDFLTKERVVREFQADLRELLLGNIGKTAVYLDHRRPRTGVFSRDWRVVDNVSRDQLLSEIEVR